jgi:hypothetical protein
LESQSGMGQTPAPGEPDAEGADAEHIAGPDEFMEAVRKDAGWRVSPRQMEAAVEALVEAGQEPTVGRVAEIATSARGDRSQRQRRHPELWRLLGAQLATHDKPASPEAQREFISRVRAAAGNQGSDRYLLQVAIQVASSEAPLEPRLVGQTANWLLRDRGEELSDEAIVEAVPGAIDAVLESRARSAAVRRRAERARGRTPTRQPRPSTGRRPRGSSYGGKRRRRS